MTPSKPRVSPLEGHIYALVAIRDSFKEGSPERARIEDRLKEARLDLKAEEDRLARKAQQ